MFSLLRPSTFAFDIIGDSFELLSFVNTFAKDNGRVFSFYHSDPLKMLALASLCSILFFGWLGHATQVLFLSTLTGAELSLVQDGSLTFEILSPSQWALKDTNYFKSFNAIIIGDPNSNDVSLLDPLVSSRAAWSPAIKGNAIVIG